ncbi:MAG: hypothetical protein JSW07_07750 [bacterium]|nr:MAG: hypothetical protein JSW07_07750 [bacterium]
MRTKIQPHAIKRCRAKTRSGKPCRNWAMPNGRCRMHGGKSPGPPLGNQNALRHGRYTRQAIAERSRIRNLIKQMNESIEELKNFVKD